MNLQSNFIVMAEQPACLCVHWSIFVFESQTLPGCTGTQKQQDPDVAAPLGPWERSLFGRGISFHGSVSAARPETQWGEGGGKTIESVTGRWQAAWRLLRVGLMDELGCCFPLLSQTWQIHIEHSFILGFTFLTLSYPWTTTV